MQCAFLLGRRQVLIAAKPVSGMPTWLLAHLGLTIRRRMIRLGRMALLRRMICRRGVGLRQRMETSFLAKAGKGYSGR